MLRALVLQSRNIVFCRKLATNEIKYKISRFYTTKGGGIMSNKGEGKFKIYHALAYRSGRCTWLVEGRTIIS